jgi:hypothetical protein
MNRELIHLKKLPDYLNTMAKNTFDKLGMFNYNKYLFQKKDKIDYPIIGPY